MRLVSVGGPDDEDPEQRRARMGRIALRMSPPDNELPGVVPVNVVLGRTDNVVVALTAALVFTTGISLSISARLRQSTADHGLFGEVHGHGRGHLGNPQLLLGVGYPDGRSATNLADRLSAFRRAEGADDRPTLVSAGGGGDDRSADLSFWLWPLPPAGDLTVVCAWPARGIAETRTVLSAAALASAAADIQQLWPWEPPSEHAPTEDPTPPDLPDGWFKDVLAPE